jgi:Uma2 family endonuclease
MTSLDQYLNTSYHPDREFVDGLVISPTRIRVPDLSVIRRSQIQGEIFTSPPHLCVEVLSERDTREYILETIDPAIQVPVAELFEID